MLLGNQRTRARARKLLKCETLTPTSWKVWGGEDEHIVIMKDGELQCDCGAVLGLCSHRVKIGMLLAPDLFAAHPIHYFAPGYKTVKIRLKKAKIPRDKSQYSRALEVLTKGKKYPPDIIEVVAEHAYKYLNGGK